MHKPNVDRTANIFVQWLANMDRIYTETQRQINEWLFNRQTNPLNDWFDYGSEIRCFLTLADGVVGLVSDVNQLKGKLTTGYGLRGISMAGAYFRLGMSRLLFSLMLLAISLVSLIPMVRYLVTSRSVYLGLKKFQGLFRKN